jgi:hypothetical protein
MSNELFQIVLRITAHILFYGYAKKKRNVFALSDPTDPKYIHRPCIFLFYFGRVK